MISGIRLRDDRTPTLDIFDNASVLHGGDDRILERYDLRRCRDVVEVDCLP